MTKAIDLKLTSSDLITTVETIKHLEEFGGNRYEKANCWTRATGRFCTSIR